MQRLKKIGEDGSWEMHLSCKVYEQQHEGIFVTYSLFWNHEL